MRITKIDNFSTSNSRDKITSLTNYKYPNTVILNILVCRTMDYQKKTGFREITVEVYVHYMNEN